MTSIPRLTMIHGTSVTTQNLCNDSKTWNSARSQETLLKKMDPDIRICRDYK